MRKWRADYVLLLIHIKSKTLIAVCVILGIKLFIFASIVISFCNINTSLLITIYNVSN